MLIMFVLPLVCIWNILLHQAVTKIQRGLGPGPGNVSEVEVYRKTNSNPHLY